MDANGIERRRNEGYLPHDEFRIELELGLARVAFMNKNWAEAEQRYAQILDRYPHSKGAAEALYWHGVSTYKKTNDHHVLGEMPERFRRTYPDSIWALKTIAWEH